MGFYLSAGVFIKEFDLTTIVPAVSTTEGGIAGDFRWGPINERMLIDSEIELIDTFWKPNNRIANDWFSASNFLSYGNKLWTVRVADQDNANTSLRAKNATCSNSSGFLIYNDDHYENNYADGTLDSTYNTGPWVGKFAGTLGNSLKVSVCPSANAFQSTLTGTITASANATTLTGIGTSFTSELLAGDLIVVNSETLKVSAITNSTSVIMTTRIVSSVSANTATRRWEYYNSVDVAPGTSDFVTQRSGSGDEMHVVVIDEDGLWTNIAGEVLEVYQKVSKASDGKHENGASSYYKEEINRKSKYIRWAAHNSSIVNSGSEAASTNFGSFSLPINNSLIGGNDGTTIGNDERIRGYNMFRSPEDVDISLIVGSAANQTVAVHIINNIVEVRKDCVAFFSPPNAYTVNNEGNEATDIVNFRNTLPSTSYAVLDNGWKYQYDRHNDVYRYLPCNADTAGVHVRTDAERDPWWAAAGLNRGHIKNVVKLAWNPRIADRDYLYKNGVNPIVTFKGDGTVLFGQKTLLAKSSAFDRINVRRLFIVLEKAIAAASRYLLFEFNDEFTRAQFKNMVEPFLRDIQGRRGIYDFLVVCDETNNTPEVIDRNEFIGDIYIKPARVAEFIKLNFIATRTGVEFSEIVGKFGG